LGTDSGNSQKDILLFVATQNSPSLPNKLPAIKSPLRESSGRRF
jgi:hypothetical protein